MPETLPLRDYQRAAIDALHTGWQAGGIRLAVLLPTGAGKTVVFSHLAAEMHARGIRTLVIAHRDELIQQAAAKIRAVAPHLRVGVVKAERDEHEGYDVIVASIQTLASPRRREAIREIGLVVVDEAHHAAAPTYMETLQHFGCFGRTPAAGFTATMKRENGGLAEVWEQIVYTRDILEMIADGHLVDVRGKAVQVEGLALDDVKTRAGDLQDGQLAQALDDSGAAEVVADAYLEHAADRPGVIFTPTVDTAKSMTDVMNKRGIRTATVWGDMHRDERTETLKAYGKGDIQVLANCMVLTEGFDAPWASCAVIARPTKSAALYVQMVGRVLRPWKDKQDALVLDVMGASTRHKLASLVDLTEREMTAPEEGETLAEAALKEDQETGPRLAQRGIDWQDVDLFHNSETRWLQTRGGTWFIPTGGESLFLTSGSEPQTFRIRLWDRERGPLAPDPDPEYPLEFAMRWAEIFAQRRAPQLARKAARWRSGQPSPKQRQLAKSLRIRVPADATAGDVSDLVDVAFASNRIDRWATSALAA
ncbi:DEAD/DEAH box helicase [Streptomyces lunaelactis]|uniref:DEAD/DEAH box helicase n=1 Tax=Streptomyces lunaelactis TaxID=1535768 RepID=UPI0015844E2F|nr:DEAD/DEAH box helicase [Streptomyces lunaelactis]NUL03574.1 DEAD/DEAH box helicase [Streptomyces lunaelactis]